MGQTFSSSSSSSIKTNNNSQEQHKKIKPNNNSQKPYDVFLSFRGEDTRYGITSHIYTALAVEKKIETYIDEKSLERGDEISPALLGAIERSKIAVIVFSEHYATSSWCLSELVHIDKCRRNLRQIVVPIFFNVDPSNVRAQYEGSYKDAFKKHEKSSKHKSETIKEWRAALEAIGSISGLHYKQSDNWPESALVKEVVETILKKLGRPVDSDVDFKGLIGMNDHFTKLESFLSDSSSKLQILGIWGMPGIGKTTIAKAVFSQLSSRFESFYFLTNVRERSEKHGLERLRDELIAELLGDKNINSGVLSSSIPEYAKERLRRTKVLLVLDDVSERNQLEHLVGNYFGSESRIIVTTRDEGVLRGTNIEADFMKYKVELLSFWESLELFNLTTFRESSSPPEYEDLPSKVVSCLGQNPLAITVFGSHLRSLRNPSKRNWEKELEKLKDVSLGGIQKVLRISYDGLEKFEKKIFLDIACFFKGKKRHFVENVLDGCNFHASTGINYLIDKSLVTEESRFDELRMHDLVQQMGWLIVREESEELCKRSRIWIAEEARRVFEEDIVNFQGTCQIEGIFLDTSKLDEEVHLKPAVFQKMCNLRLLKIYDERDFNRYCRDTMKHNVYVEELDYFPRSLTYLEWKRCPLKSLPSKFNPCNLVELKMPYSQLETLWHGIKILNKLACIDLSHSINLTQIPDLSRSKNLETLNLESCTSLVKVPWDSLRNLSKLLDLNLGGCHKIGDFPDRIDSGVLKTLSLSGCHLKTVPAIVSRSLVSLKLDSTNIVSVPSSIGSMSSLKELSFNFCRLLKNLPSSIAQLNCLEGLSLKDCSSLEMFPVLPSNIKKLSMSQAVIKEVPSSCFEHCSRLSILNICYCKELESLPSNIFRSESSLLCLDGCLKLKNLPEIPNLAKSKLEELSLSKSGIRNLPLSIGKLTNLKILSMMFCENLEFVDNLSMSSLTQLYVWNCKKLQRISQLPLSLQFLHATGSTSLEIVTDSRLNEFRNRFWDNSPERLKLEQSLIDFQLRVLHMAIRRNKLELALKNHPIEIWYSGDKIPEWFNHRSNNDSPNSITIPLPLEWPCPDFLGFALCAVVSSKPFTFLHIDCKIKFQTEDLVFKTRSVPIPYSESDQVVMWYPDTKDKMYPDTAGEVTFEFSIIMYPSIPDSGEIKACGVHMLCWSDLPELVELETEESLVKIADRKRRKENDDEISSSLVKRQRF